MSQSDATGEASDGTAGVEAAGVDRRQLALVACCLVGLVVAAFVAPVAPDPGGPGAAGAAGGGSGQGGGSGSGQAGGSGSGQAGGSGSGQGGGSGGGGSGSGAGESGGGSGGGGGDGGGGGGNGRGDGSSDPASDEDSGEISDGGDPVPVPGGEVPETEQGCGVVVENEPIPGGTVAVSVYVDLEPTADVPVWFGDRLVGRTDDAGRVTGRVPYSRELNVTVDVPGEDCEFFRRRYEDRQSTVGAVEGDPVGVASVDAVDSSARTVRASGLFGGSGPRSHPSGTGALTDGRTGPETQRGLTAALAGQESPAAGNDTGTYEVDGAVAVSVAGDPYPGETVTVRASVEGVPMRSATVRVDGERVGETTERGRYELPIPRGERRVTVGVERGDFSGSRTVDVWVLDVSVVPQEGLPFPGEPALVNASAGPEPSANATVSLGGSRVGATDASGTATLTLPVDPRGTVTVRTSRQSAAASLWSAYASTLSLGALLLAAVLVAVVVTGYRRGRRSARRVAVWWAGLAVTFVGLVVGEVLGLVVTTGAVLLWAATLHRETVLAGGGSAAGTLADLVAFVRWTALAVADWVALALDRVRALLGRLAARVAALPLSVRALAARLWGWTRTLPARIRAAVAARLSGRAVAAAVVACGLLVGLTVRFGAVGLLAALAGLFVGFLAYRAWTRDGADDPTDAETGTPVATDAGRAAAADDGAKRRTLRAVWRRFARWVRPHSWRQSTPGEVSRAAIERGFPERPVRTLTEAFREVEYGDRSPTDRSEAAREAMESIEREREGEES